MQCLKNKSLIGFGVIAAMLAGCQTAQKHETVDASFLAIPSNYGADRAPAGFGGPLDDLLKLLTKDGKNGKTEVTEAYRALNSSKDPQIAAARKELGGAFKEENISSIDRTLQAKLVDELAKLPRFRTRFGFVAEYKEIATRAKSIMAKGAKGGAEEMKATGAFSHNGLLSTGSKVEKGKVYAPEVLDRYYQRTLVNASFEGREAAWGTLKVNETGKIVGNATDEQRQAFESYIGAMKSARDYSDATGGRSIINSETCRNLAGDADATNRYKELLDRHVASAREAGGKVCPELEAWVAARFQMALGREGLSAWTSAGELATCNFERAEVRPAADKLAKQFHGEVPDTAPKCK
jgi:hypothetical protein